MEKKKKKIKTIEITKETSIEDRAIYATADYLRSIGWSCLIGGFKGIAQGEEKYKFDLIFNFVGNKKKINPKMTKGKNKAHHY